MYLSPVWADGARACGAGRAWLYFTIVRFKLPARFQPGCAAHPFIMYTTPFAVVGEDVFTGACRLMCCTLLRAICSGSFLYNDVIQRCSDCAWVIRSHRPPAACTGFELTSDLNSRDAILTQGTTQASKCTRGFGSNSTHHASHKYTHRGHSLSCSHPAHTCLANYLAGIEHKPHG